MIAMNNLDWQFQVHISEPKENTTMQDFFDGLDGKASIWREIEKYDMSPTGPAPRLRYISYSNFQAGVSRSN